MSTCSEKSIAIYHIAGAATDGTNVPVPDPDSLGNMYKHITVINDSDQDIKVSLKNTQGVNQAFIVPVSIKGYTKSLKSYALDNTTLTVTSMDTGSAAVGNITFNLGS